MYSNISVYLSWCNRNRSVVGLNPTKDHYTLSKKLYHHCLVQVGSRNGFERDFIVELKSPPP